MNPTSNRHETIAGLLGAMCLAGAAHAQFSPIVDPPWAPTDLSPTSGTYQGRLAGGTPLILGWSQYLPGPGGGLLLKPAATHFIVCVRAGASAPPCSLATADFRETIAAPSAALTQSGARFTFMPSRSLADSMLNDPLRFTVGSCSAMVERSCTYTSVDTWYLTFNPSSDGIGQNLSSTTSNWKFNANALNDADSPAPRFTGRVELFEVLHMGMPGRTCLQKPDDPSVADDPSLVVIDKFGGHTPMPMVKRESGVYTGPPVAGIFRLGSFTTSKSYVTDNDPAVAARAQRSTAVKVVDFPIPINPLVQRTFVVIHSIDTPNAIHEFNENDNAIAQCKVR
jgi:hypothetical protein